MNPSMHGAPTPTPQQLLRLRASAEVANITAGTIHGKKAIDVALQHYGWKRPPLHRYLDHDDQKRWAPQILESDADELKSFKSYNSSDDGEIDKEKVRPGEYIIRVKKDIKELMKASRDINGEGRVSIRSWYKEVDPKKVIITFLPILNDPDLNYVRAEILDEVLPKGHYIILIHNSIALHHQKASAALKKKWVMGFNSHPSAFDRIVFSNLELVSVEVSKLYEALFKNIFNTDEAASLGLEHRDKIPSIADLEEKIGSKRFNELANECTVNVITGWKSLAEKEGQHALLPPLLLSWKSIVGNRQLFGELDQLLQERVAREVNDSGENDEEGSSPSRDENEEEVRLAADPTVAAVRGGNKQSKKRKFKDTYSDIEGQSENDQGILDHEIFVQNCKEYLEESNGIMEMLGGKLEGALKERFGGVYCAFSIFRSIQHFLAKPVMRKDLKSKSLQKRHG